MLFALFSDTMVFLISESLVCSKEQVRSLDDVFIGMKKIPFLWYSWILCGILMSLCVRASANAEPNDDSVISRGGAIAGAVLRADVDRLLVSVEICMAEAPAPSGGFSLALHEDSGNGDPGMLLCELEGSMNPAESRTYRYQCKDGLVLVANEQYWLVASVKEEGAIYRYQTLPVSSGGQDSVACDSFLKITGSGGSAEIPMATLPAFFAVFDQTTRLADVGHGDRFKFLWSGMLLLVILICCVDRLPFWRFSQ